MSDIDQGAQEILLDFESDLDAEVLSERFHGIVPLGIHEGFQTSQVTSVKVKLTPGVMEISDGDEHQVRVQTNESIRIEPTESSPFVVARWSYKDQVDWYANFTKASSIKTDDIIFCKAEFDNNGDISGLDFSDRSHPEIESTLTIQDALRTRGARYLNQTLVESDSYTVDDKDHAVEVDTNKASSPTITLPEIVEQGQEVIVHDAGGNASSQNIKVEANKNVEDIEGNSDITLTNDFESVTLLASLALERWIIIANE